MTNILSKPTIDENISELFRVVGQPVRIRILLVIGRGESCVCHLESYLGERQAAISQHLKVLLDSGLVEKNREGRNIYYRLSKPEILDLVRQAAGILNISSRELEDFASTPLTPCSCPKCIPGSAGCSQPSLSAP